ncbi:MAG: ATP-binding protein [bacterium]
MIRHINYGDYPVLFVDNNNTEELLSYRKRLGNIFSVLITHTTDDAFNIIENTPNLAVIISGQNLPQILGTEFLSRVHDLYPDVLQIMLADRSDFEVALEAVDQGNIYKYLFKPCKHDILKLEIMRAIEQYVLECEYRLLFEERIGLERLSIIGELAAGFVHEIRNPVAVISLNAEMGLCKLSDESIQIEKMQGVLSEILSQCQRLSGAIDHIMEFARPNRMDYAHIELEELIERAVFFIRKEMDFEHMEIIKDIPKKFPRLYGDRVQLEQVFMSLLRNSYHAMGGQGTIYIKGKTLSKGNEIEIEHQDFGQGISKENFKFILSQFFTHKQNGTGIGLYLAHKIIQSLGGKMVVDEDGGSGNRIRINLPVLKPMQYIPTDFK